MLGAHGKGCLKQGVGGSRGGRTTTIHALMTLPARPVFSVGVTQPRRDALGGWEMSAADLRCLFFVGEAGANVPRDC
jgi:hypothetical protein